MYICQYCRTATETVSEWHGQKIHVCAPDCYDLAIDINNHDCTKFQEKAYTPEGILFSRCFICTEAVEQGFAPDPETGAAKSDKESTPAVSGR